MLNSLKNTVNLQLHIKICITPIITSFVNHVELQKEEKTFLTGIMRIF